MNRLAVCIKTFHRFEPIKELLASLKENLPGSKIYIADDSYDVPQEKKDLYDRYDATVIYPPKNSGISVGRNMLMRTVSKDYVLLCDDDFYIGENNGAKEVLDFLDRHQEIDIVCGLLYDKGGAETHYEWDIEIVGDVIRKKLLTSLWQEDILKYRKVDIGFNFFIARKSVFEKVMWDERLVVSTEHTDFFLSAKQAGLSVVYSPNLVAYHHSVPPDKQYQAFRHRAFHWHDFADKWGINWAEEEGSDERINYHDEANKWADYKMKKIIYRNDDVSVDSDVEQLRTIRDIFERNGVYEHYSVIPFGKTKPLFDGYDPSLTLEQIDKMLGNSPITENKEVCDFLEESLKRGHQIMLHGWKHTRIGDYDQEYIDDKLAMGRGFLEKKFRTKIRYLAAPFNQSNDKIERACQKLQVKFLWNDGDALEQCVREGKPVTTDFTWYHYWRFFRGDLSPEKLEQWLKSQL